MGLRGRPGPPARAIDYCEDSVTVKSERMPSPTMPGLHATA